MRAKLQNTHLYMRVIRLFLVLEKIIFLSYYYVCHVHVLICPILVKI